ncbi:DNA helicase IV [Nocardioides aquaticus]|uniref:DNA helicase IV n=1 Tax=Nocardioides aquaticus TaxID=160826 RepID=A0ABX8ELT8_9ACTN|nr:ATP-binding domain-containing protein [Nocardioides aquaticus]QVT81489.1 DNA helicase IV [Nocardioides aquaticus]
MSSVHPELSQEQAFVDRAYQLLDKGLGDAERSMADFQSQHRSTAVAIQRALRVLKESKGTGQLVFGKMRSDGEDLYIGRRRVRDENYEPVVVGWHAPAAQAFYEASPTEPGDLSLKRVFTEEQRRLVRVIDEIVASSAGDASDPGVGSAFSDALLEELDRSRDGAMRDVVATIQSEQFRIIRAPLDRMVVVQGGPGTGKTVVGLHRAAWLAFNHEELRRAGVLVVAPSTTFLTYVSGVLPSLDVTDVDQVELQRLYAGEAEAVSAEETDTARIKGTAAMASVLARALEQRVGWGDDDLVLSLGADRITVPAEDIRVIVSDVSARRLAHSDARDQVRARLSQLAHEKHREEQRAAGRPVRANEATIRRLSAFTNAVDRMWPNFTPEELLRSLYGTQTWLLRATDGLLTPDERARLYRPMAESIGQEPWTEADLFCLDEAAALLTRDTVTYGHLVVDEAQDLSPMQARALARRCPHGSFTILGDLAQTTGPWLRRDWTELTQHLGSTATDLQTLSIGYRVPAPVLELAAHQLPLTGEDLVPPTSIRSGLGPPEILDAGPDGLQDTVVTVVEEKVAAGMSTAVLVPDATYDDWLASLRSADLAPGDGRDGDFAAKVTVVPQSGCKGLEFDAVVLVEPAELAAESLHPPRALYVAMTRCTQDLTVVHAAPLPPGLAAPAPSPARGEDDADVEALAEPAPPEDPRLSHPGTEPRPDLHEMVDRLSDADADLLRSLIGRLLDEGTPDAF